MSTGASPGRVAIEGVAHRRLIKTGPGDNPCWFWQGSLTSAGYPRKRWFGRELSARRWLYALLVGVVPGRRVLEAKCGERLCVNPFHMRAVAMAEAQRSGEATKLLPGDAAEMRRRLADPRCRGAAFRSTLIGSIAEEYGLTREYAVDVLGNRYHRDPALPVGIVHIIAHYRTHPPKPADACA